MSLALKTKQDITHLKARADLLKKIRAFFEVRGVMEVETPLLCETTATDPHIHSIRTVSQHSHQANDYDATQTRQKPPHSGGDTQAIKVFFDQCYLQTSPEFAMKKLLAKGSGPIFQICKAFRDEPCGRYHNPEFTMLEWYRPELDHNQLMDEIDQLLQHLGIYLATNRISYQTAFIHQLALDPLNTTCGELSKCAKQHHIDVHDTELTQDAWLDLLFSHLIQPNLIEPTFIFDYPASQSALAKIRAGNPSVAERFELFINGIELANGYHELTDSTEQKQRFMADNQARQQMGLPTLPIDNDLIKALDDMPSCAGVALGVDRLLMLLTNCDSLNRILN